MKRLHVIVRGRVQGVYFRASARDRARQLGLKGWVRNCPDGRVELVAEGEEERLVRLLTWCHGGPPGAVVTDLEVQWQDATGEFSGFVIRY
ncbi:MAG: acylphosphatase [Thermodesulfobacteriota bacterium]|jgi:acylphosphatase